MTALLSYLRYPLYATSFLTLALTSALWYKQNALIYPRNIPPDARTNVPQPADFSLDDTASLHIPTPDGASLHAYWLRAPGARTTVLMFHGNAGNIGHRLPIADVLRRGGRVHVVMLEYRGYGLSTGDPEERGLKVDAQAGLDWIRAHEVLRDTRVVIYGQSLGGAVGIDLAVKNQGAGDIGAVMLENTFLSIKKMIPEAFPPARYLTGLCTQAWGSEKTIRQLRVPTLFLSGMQDEIIPPWHMKTLYDLAGPIPKVFKLFPGGTHNDTVTCPGYFDAIFDFLGSAL